VIGAGNAGCPVAAGLVGQGYSVLLVEDGKAPATEQDILDQISPRLGFDQWVKDSTAYTYNTDEDLLGNRQQILHGRGLGGTTLINGGVREIFLQPFSSYSSSSFSDVLLLHPQLYTRPDDQDFDNWGISFWDSASVNPFFVEMETYVPATSGHGTSGPVRIQAPLTSQSLEDDILGFLEGIDFDIVDDGTSGSAAPGTAFKVKYVRQENGQRLDAFTAFIVPILESVSSSLLTVVSNTRATEILFNEGTPNVVIGAHFLTGGKNSWRAFVNHEVIISAGTFGTPKLLQLSGIGASADLVNAGITPRVSLPQVGKNLIARPLSLLAFSGTELLPDQDISQLANTTAIEQFLSGAGGWYSIPIDGLIGFGATNPAASLSDFMIQFTTVQPFFYLPIPTAFGFPCLLNHPVSRGFVTAVSANPFDDPRVFSGIFTDTEGVDLTNMAACISLVSRVRNNNKNCFYFYYYFCLQPSFFLFSFSAGRLLLQVVWKRWL